MAKEKEQRQPMPPVTAWAPALALGWLIPGAGHFLLKRPGRGALLMASITGMFLCGIMMRGAMFHPQSGDLLTLLINTGGFIGDLCSGLLYLLTQWFPYDKPDVVWQTCLYPLPGSPPPVCSVVYDYGTKFLVTAGLLNVLAMVDVFEIAAGRKD